MSQIKTFQDGTSMGTFSQINLDDGNKILISLTQTEIAIMKMGFLGIPKGTLWKEDMDKFLDIIYPEGPASENADISVLKIAVNLALPCKTIAEIEEKFSQLTLEDEEIESGNSFKKELPTDKLAEWNIDSFDRNYKLAYKRLKNIFENKKYNITQDIDRELRMLLMFEITWVVIIALGMTEQSKSLISKIEKGILLKHFVNKKQTSRFFEIYWDRKNEYADAMNFESDDSSTKVGEVFYKHLATRDKESRDVIVRFVSLVFFMILKKDMEFFEDVISKCEIV